MVELFLQRQEIRHRKMWLVRLKQAERILVSVTVVLAGFAALYGLYYLTFLGPSFTVRNIVADGPRHRLSADELAMLSGVREGDNLFWVSVADVYRCLKTNPWIKEAAVRRRLPDTLWLHVMEYEPVAVIAATDGLSYVSKEGNVFKHVEARDDKLFPVLTGFPSDSDFSAGDTRPRILEMLGLLKEFSRSGLGSDREVAEVHYDEADGYSLVVESSGAVATAPVRIVVGNTTPLDRLKQVDRMFGAITGRGGQVQYIVANKPGRVIVKYNGTSEHRPSAAASTELSRSLARKLAILTYFRVRSGRSFSGALRMDGF